MAKQKRNDVPHAMVQPVPVGPEGAAVQQAVRYAFSSAARCPGCRGTDTYVVKTEGNIRYWRCRTPRCHFSDQGGQRTWKEIGTPI